MPTAARAADPCHPVSVAQPGGFVRMQRKSMSVFGWVLAVSFVLVSGLVVAAPTPLLAQTAETGVLQGLVMDTAGDPVAAVAVTLAQPDGAYPRQGTTNQSGSFRFGFLPPGSYDLNVQRIGYRAQTVTGVQVHAASVAAINVSLEVAAVELAGITVVASDQLIDRQTTEISSVVATDQIDRLPTARTATDLLKFTPGISPGQIFGGSTAQANSYQLDGVSVNQPGFGGDFLLPNVDWIKEITVKGLGAGAEYGNFQGGLVNIVTKSGTNTWQGQVRFNYEGSDLAASNINTFEAGSELDNRYEINGEVQGPLIRNKLFLYASAQEVRSNVRVVDVLSGDENHPAFLVGSNGGFLTEDRRQFKLLGKLTWQATASDAFNLYVGKDDFYTDNAGLNSFDSFETSLDQESPATFYNASWQRTFSADQLLEVKVTGYTGSNDFLAKGGDLPAVQLLGGNRNTYRNAIFGRTREPKSTAASVNWDSYWTTGALDHHLKVGGDLEFGSWLETRQRTGGLTWRPELSEDEFDAADPTTWGFISSDWGGDIRLDASTLNGAVFVQDYIQVTDELSVNPGLRLGFWQGDLNPTGGGSISAVDDVKIAPRLGLVYDVGGRGEWVAKGHYGRYYQSLFALMFDRAEGGDVFQPTEFWDWIDDDFPDISRAYSLAEREQLFEFFGDEGGAVEAPVENYAQPYVDQFVVGLERSFGDGWKAGVTYVNRVNKDILAMQDRNLATNYTTYENVEVIDFREDAPVLGPDGEPLVLPRLKLSNDDILFLGEAPGLTPGQVDALTYEEDLVLSTAKDAERKFDQIQLSIEREAETWSAGASLVWTDLRGNFFSVSGYEDPFGIGAGPFVHPNEQTNFSGDLDNYSDWEAKLRISGDLPLEFRGGAFLEVVSGEHYTPFYVIDRRNHDFYTSDGEYIDPELLFGVDGESIFLESRGSRTLDSRATLDVHLDRTVSLASMDVILGLDVFNLFGSDAVTSVKREVNDQFTDEPTTLFNAPRFRVDPRAVRLWATMRFP